MYIDDMPQFSSKNFISFKEMYSNPCHGEYIKMPRPPLIFSQIDYLIQFVDTNSHGDLYCLQRQGIYKFSRTRVKTIFGNIIIHECP